MGQLRGAGRGFAHPERDRGRLALGVGHPDDAGRHLADLPGVSAEQEDVAGHRLGGPVFVHRADEQLVGLQHHPEVADLGDGAARREGGQPGSGPGPDLAVDPVEMEVGGPPAPPGRDPVAHHGQDLVEGLPGQVPVGVGPADQCEERVDRQAPRSSLGGGGGGGGVGVGVGDRGAGSGGGGGGGGHLGHQLLGQDVEGGLGRDDGVERSGLRGPEQGGALHQFVAG